MHGLLKQLLIVVVLKLMAIEDVTSTVQEEANTVDVEGTVSANYSKEKEG